MKKIINSLFFLIFLISCNKENSSSSNSSSSKASCNDNPNINFNSIGVPQGKFTECIKDVDGNIYKTVVIGSQTWMAENLKTSKYNDGSDIIHAIDFQQWKANTSGAYCYYDNDQQNEKKYGKLYNWYSVDLNSNGNKNICPTGWSVPDTSDFYELLNFLGDDAQFKIKEIGSKWTENSDLSTNASLFTALPSGSRSTNFVGINEFTSFWTSNTNEFNIEKACHLQVYMNAEVKGSLLKNIGASVRCIKKH